MSYNRYFSPAQVESDQKDLIISQLKADIFELRKNQQDYFELSHQLKNLEQRYQMLNEEKARNEIEFKSKQEQSIKLIANLKSDIDTLHSSLKEKNIELQELKADSVTLNEVSQHRAMEVMRLKNELQGSNENNNRLKDEKFKLEHRLDNLKEDKKKILLDIDAAQKDIDELSYRISDQEKILKEQDFEKNRLEKQIFGVQNNNQSQRQELKQLQENLGFLENQRLEAQRNLSNLEKDIVDLENINEKVKQESVNNLNSFKLEQNRNHELNQQHAHLENISKSRDNQIADVKRDINNINNENAELVENNSRMSYDLEALKRHIEILNERNADLIEDLDKFSEQDDLVRQLLNRKNRVKDIRVNVESTTRKVIGRQFSQKSPIQNISAKQSESLSKQKSPYH